MSDGNSHRQARELMQRSKRGVLSTLSREAAGYPFGSVVPFCLDREGRPVILIAGIAEHTRNIQGDPRVCLTVFDEGAEDLQESARVSLMADAARVEGDDAAERYVRHYPRSRSYHRTHDFDYYSLTPVRVRYIGGFGDIHWLRPEDLLRPNPFRPPVETAILEHMNQDHLSALRHYVRTFRGLEPGEGELGMAGIDGEGFDLLLGRRLLRIAFERPVSTPQEAREALVAMARAPLSERAAPQQVE